MHRRQTPEKQSASSAPFSPASQVPAPVPASSPAVNSPPAQVPPSPPPCFPPFYLPSSPTPIHPPLLLVFSRRKVWLFGGLSSSTIYLSSPHSSTLNIIFHLDLWFKTQCSGWIENNSQQLFLSPAEGFGQVCGVFSIFLPFLMISSKLSKFRKKKQIKMS